MIILIDFALFFQVSTHSHNQSHRNVSASDATSSLDSEGLFVLEGMEESVGNEPGHSEGESDTDHDGTGQIPLCITYFPSFR